ncbi:hypothetical protein FNF28_01737 [Cafeteria roenbergensis]|uniref:ATP-dependent RNA helicase n=1 Tax=Cafeteria roenbergensis TaxID=33653 RepID=A0A5A8DZA9_CAFRO|nr:hypothetical protein FNF28_01737 [Cafeteria roenbergensis]
MPGVGTGPAVPGAASRPRKRHRTAAAALTSNKWTKLTDVQRAAVPHALAGRDVLGAAKTGSGKTLAFLVPIVELLFRERWSAEDGVGAIIITPTRELALQIMQALRRLGTRHPDLTAGLLCGGKAFSEEQAVLGRLSVVVATPGRLQQHLEQSPELDTSSLRALVLDEADRLLDMGFAPSINAILGALPTERQTMLFSATQTRDVSRLASLSLRDPEYVSVHEAAVEATPRRLVQAYVVCPLADKVNLLWSFVKAHLKQRTIVFVSSTKQARFLFEVLRRLRPGVPVMELHGRIAHDKRTAIYSDFLKKKAAVMLATDVAARGLDFPGLDWVLQLDCPEDAATYIHRVGRTARFRMRGNGLLVLLPSEAPAMLQRLRDAKVPLKRITIAAAQARSVQGLVAAEVAADSHLRYLAQRAFASYVRSVMLQPDSEVFDAAELDADALATSYGLPSTPRAKALEGAKSREESSKLRNRDRKLQRLKDAIRSKQDDDKDGDSDGDGDSGSDSSSGSDSDGKRARQAAKARAAPASEEELESDSDSDSESDFGGDAGDATDLLWRKEGGGAKADDGRAATAAELLAGIEGQDMPGWQRARAQRVTEGAIETGRRAAGGADAGFKQLAAELGASKGSGRKASAAAVEAHAAAVAARLQAQDGADRERDRLRVRAKHRLERLQARGREDEDDDDDEEDGGHGAVLGGSSDDDDDDDDDSNAGSAGDEAAGDDSGDDDDSDAEGAELPAKRPRDAASDGAADDEADLEAKALKLLEARGTAGW